MVKIEKPFKKSINSIFLFIMCKIRFTHLETKFLLILTFK